MRVVVVGLGIQGYKRRDIAGYECVATVDPINKEADVKSIEDVPLNTYDAALVCTPDGAKIAILNYLLSNGKHVMVEKPLWSAQHSDLLLLEELAVKNQVVCYTAYNHRFEPHFVQMRNLLQSNVLGKIYHCRLFYGNGTARLVRESGWRDKGAGVLPDLGSHMLDTLFDWFGSDIQQCKFNVMSSSTFENQAPDHVIFSDFASETTIEVEMSLLSWRNHFTCDITAELGSAHISSLCKWGPSTFIHRNRILPSGRPTENAVTLVQSDPTWALEYSHFKNLCANVSQEDIAKQFSVDKWIYDELIHMNAEAVLQAQSKQLTEVHA